MCMPVRFSSECRYFPESFRCFCFLIDFDIYCSYNLMQSHTLHISHSWIWKLFFIMCRQYSPFQKYLRQKLCVASHFCTVSSLLKKVGIVLVTLWCIRVMSVPLLSQRTGTISLVDSALFGDFMSPAKNTSYLGLHRKLPIVWVVITKFGFF